MHPLPDKISGEHYLNAVAELLSDWFLICGHNDAPLTPFREATRYMALPPPAAGKPIRSRLAADGAPVELCERIGPACQGPAYTIDPVPFVTDPGSRLEMAHVIASRLLRNTSGNADIMEQSRAVLSPRYAPEEQASLWIGIVHQDNGDERIKLYYNLNGHASTYFWPRAERFLQQLDLMPSQSPYKVLAHLGQYATLRQLALSVTRSGRLKAKLYFRLRRVNAQLLDELANSAGVESHIFHRYVQRMLGAGSGWCDPNAGIGIALDGGEIEALALYHYTRAYFRDDAALRHRVLEMAPEFGWDTRVYRTSSRFLDVPVHPRLRTLIGFGVTRTGMTGLNIYARSGHLAAPIPNAKASMHHKTHLETRAYY